MSKESAKCTILNDRQRELEIHLSKCVRDWSISLLLNVPINVVHGAIVLLTEHIKATLTNIHTTEALSALIILFFSKCFKLKRLHTSVGPLLSLQLLAVGSCLGQTVLVDLCIEWLAFALGLLEV